MNTMSAYVACNAKYYKKNQWEAVSRQIYRLSENIENLRPELSHENFGHQFADFFSLEKRMIDAKQTAGLRARGFQSDSNVVIDNVLIFSNERVEELKMSNPDGYKNDILKAAVSLSECIRDRFGFEPMAIEFNWDQGREDSRGNFINNYHAHMQFFNFDFKNLNQPLRTLNRKDFSQLQDLAGEYYRFLGFERGIPKKITNNKHLEKVDFILKQKNIEIALLEDEIKRIKSIIEELNIQVFNKA